MCVAAIPFISETEVTNAEQEDDQNVLCVDTHTQAHTRL
jgi:hypothetical protein